MHDFKIWLTILRNLVLFGLFQIDDYITSLLHPDDPVKLQDLHKVSTIMEKVFKEHHLRVIVAGITMRPRENIFELQHDKYISQEDINEALPDIIAKLHAEQWQIRPVELGRRSGKSCLAVMLRDE